MQSTGDWENKIKASENKLVGVFSYHTIFSIKIQLGIAFERFVVTTILDFSRLLKRHVNILPDFYVPQLLIVVREVELDFFQCSPFGLG